MGFVFDQIKKKGNLGVVTPTMQSQKKSQAGKQEVDNWWT